MAENTQPRIYDREAMFEWFYNGGRRRSYVQVQEQFGCSYSAVRKIADEEDWNNRADMIDEEARRITSKRLARAIADTRANAIEGAAAVISRFVAYRLLPKTADGKWTAEALRPEEITPTDFANMAKLVELLAGGATIRIAGEDRDLVLADLEKEIAALDAGEPAGEIEAGG